MWPTYKTSTTNTHAFPFSCSIFLSHMISSSTFRSRIPAPIYFPFPFRRPCHQFPIYAKLSICSTKHVPSISFSGPGSQTGTRNHLFHILPLVRLCLHDMAPGYMYLAGMLITHSTTSYSRSNEKQLLVPRTRLKLYFKKALKVSFPAKNTNEQGTFIL